MSVTYQVSYGSQGGGSVDWSNVENIDITDADVNAAAEIAASKIADGAAYDVLGTSSDGTTVAWVSGITDNHVAAGAAIALSKLATDPLARAEHTGTQLAATISDFDTQVATTALLKSLAAAKGDLIVATGNDTFTVLPAATNDQVLTLDDGEAAGVKWADAPSGSGIPATTVDAKGDLIAGTADDTVDNLTVGANDTVLVADSGQTTGLKYQKIVDANVDDAAEIAVSKLADGGANQLIRTDSGGTGVEWFTPTYFDKADIAAKGDLIVGSADNTTAILTAGTDTHVLTANSAATNGVEWAAPGGGGIAETLIDAKGDLIAGSAADTAAKVTVGANDTLLVADSAQSTGVKWATTATQGIAQRYLNSTDFVSYSQGANATNKLLGCTYDPTYVAIAADALTDARAVWVPITLPKGTITGLVVFMAVAGNFTGDQENSFGLYTSDGTTLSRVAISSNDANIWKSTANTQTAFAFTSPYTSAGGTFWIGYLYNNSAQTTAPQLYYVNPNTSLGAFGSGSSERRFHRVYKSATTALPSSQTWATLTDVTDNKITLFGAY